MSGEIVNLRQARKAKDRALHAADGAANRVKYGRSRQERLAATRAAELADRRLDGHRREIDGSAGMTTGPNDGDAA